MLVLQAERDQPQLLLHRQALVLLQRGQVVVQPRAGQLLLVHHREPLQLLVHVSPAHQQALVDARQLQLDHVRDLHVLAVQRLEHHHQILQVRPVVPSHQQDVVKLVQQLLHAPLKLPQELRQQLQVRKEELNLIIRPQLHLQKVVHHHRVVIFLQLSPTSHLPIHRLHQSLQLLRLTQSLEIRKPQPIHRATLRTKPQNS